MSFPRVFDRLKVVTMKLTPRARRAVLDQLIEWAQWERDLAEDEAELDRELAPASGREVVDGSRRRQGGMVLQLEKVKCGKPTCRSCPHGPYWYGYYWQDGKQRSRYIGKKLPPELSSVEGAALPAEHQPTGPHEDAPG
jgi:hypothetical protein